MAMPTIFIGHDISQGLSKPQIGIILIIDSYFTIFTNLPHSPLCILVVECPTTERFPTNLFWWDGNKLGLGLVGWCRWML
jgi:hypothetical protein